MRKWLSVAAVVVLSLALVVGIACGDGDEGEEGVKKLKFGWGMPMSGAGGAVAGIPLLYSLELYQDWYPEFEVAGQKYEWDFAFEDTMPGGAVSVQGGYAAATKLIYEYGADILFSTPSDAAVAATQITEELDPPMLLFVGYAGMFEMGPDIPHTFNVMQINDLELLPFFDWLVKEYPEVKTVAMTTSESALGKIMDEGTEAVCDYYGLELHSVTTPEVTVEWYPIATKMMTFDPDLVLGNAQLMKPMWELGYEGLSASNYWSEAGYGQVPWDKAAGKTFIYQPHPMQEPWPEVAAFATEYEDRFGVEVTPSILMGLILPYWLAQALEQAGTVTDVDKIIEALETGTFDTALGPVHFGGEELIGLDRVLMMPQPIWKIVGPGEYEVVAHYTAEELDTLAQEVYGGR